MPSFDVVSKIDHQSLDNAVNNARKEILNRYDFHDSKTEIELNKKDLLITVVTENEMRVKAIQDVLIARLLKQNIDPGSLDASKEHYASGNMIRKELKVKEGIDRDTARKIVSHIKGLKLKVEPQIQDDQVRVTAKKIDDLQAVIAALRTEQAKLGLPLQFVNMK